MPSSQTIWPQFRCQPEKNRISMIRMNNEMPTLHPSRSYGLPDGQPSTSINSQELKRLRLIADAISGVVIFTDRDGCINWTNKAFNKITNLSSYQTLGRNLLDILEGSATHPSTINHITRCIRAGKGFKAEILGRSAQANTFCLEIESIPIATDDNELEGYLMVGANISTIKTVIAEMLHAQNILRTVLDMSPLYVSVKDHLGKYIFYNKNYENEFIAEGANNKVLTKEEERVFSTGEMTGYEQAIILNDRQRDFLTFRFPVEDASGEIYGGGMVAVDISERRLAQRALKKREELYYSTLQCISDAVVLMDTNFRIVYLNPSAEKLTGSVLADVKGKEYSEVILMRKYGESNQSINPLQCEINTKATALSQGALLRCKDGNEFPVGEGKISTMSDSSGQFSGLALFFKDISDKLERTRLEEEMELRTLAAIIEGQEKERDRIAKELHDGLGQMLNLIKMKVDISGSDKTKKLSALIAETIQETARIAENLAPSKLRDFDLFTALNSLCKQLNHTYSSRIKFYSFGNPENINETRKINLFRIAQEAIHNALKHAEASLITVSISEDTDKIQLTVEDNGQGVKAAEHYADLSTHNKPHHGLMNMKKRASIMGGNFTIESEPDRGTLVIVVINLTPAEPCLM